MNEVNPFSAPSVVNAGTQAEGPVDDSVTRLRRLGAAMIDGLISAVIIWVYILMVMGKTFDKKLVITTAEAATLTVLGVLVFLLLHGYLLYRSGQTLGKYLCGIKIVTMAGEKPDFIKLILLRYGPLWVLNLVPALGRFLPLVDILVIFGKEKRCLHDYLAGTKVVKA